MRLDNDGSKGTEKDGSRSGDYCIHCYADGAFTKEMTMDEMIRINIRYLDEWIKSTGIMITEEEAIKQLQQFLPTLKRWKR